MLDSISGSDEVVEREFFRQFPEPRSLWFAPDIDYEGETASPQGTPIRTLIDLKGLGDWLGENVEAWCFGDDAGGYGIYWSGPPAPSRFVQRENPNLPPGFEGFGFDEPEEVMETPTFDNLQPPLSYGDLVTFGGKKRWKVVSVLGTYSIDVEVEDRSPRARTHHEARLDPDSGEIKVVQVGYVKGEWGRIVSKVYDRGNIHDLEVVGTDDFAENPDQEIIPTTEDESERLGGALINYALADGPLGPGVYVFDYVVEEWLRGQGKGRKRFHQWWAQYPSGTPIYLSVTADSVGFWRRLGFCPLFPTTEDQFAATYFFTRVP